ncbi:lipase family protein [Tenacibaculum tangerinum]|uniref:Lipase family protein n=1 Tax=Tenacibaculum tangerinum TaxID=3038772 RepID=A0ABY8L0Y5_9FLAO|nr:lipase family protein [Tenacibaculum tangerinum]WGH75131.1 lipase family protein [Tenacibaculum tangerinum]
MKRIALLWLCCFSSAYMLFGQVLKPGFNPNEYAEMLRIGMQQNNPVPDTVFPKALKFDVSYESPTMGMGNAWQLWTAKPNNPLKVAVISLRATTEESSSWAENLHSVMVNATGKLSLEKNFTFNYRLAKNQRASVHIGWLIGTAYLQRDITPKIDSCYQKGIKDFIITGHSQGGALSYLLRAYYQYEQLAGRIPSDITFKMYASAAPKPGNLYFAQDYESYTQKGWSYNVVNSEDWVPQVPLSMQTMGDFAASNPFKYYKKGTEDLPLLSRWVVRGKFKGIMRRMDRSKRKYNRIMGKEFGVLVQEFLPEYKIKSDYTSTNYQRCGNQITLLADEDYYIHVRRNHPNVFRNHGLDAYQLLLETYYAQELASEYVIYANNTYPFLKEFPRTTPKNVSNE